jgi:hypothetical protein
MKPNKLITLALLAVFTNSCEAQQKTKNTMEQKIQSFAVLEETENRATHLMSLVKEERTDKEDYPFLPHLNNGDFFLRCETWNVEKNNESRYIQHCFMLHFIPQKQAKYYRIESRLEVLAFYEDGKNTGHGEPSGEWQFMGNSNENTIEAKILNYWLAHQSEIEVIKDETADSNTHLPDSIIGKTFSALISQSCARTLNGGVMSYKYCDLSFAKDSVTVTFRWERTKIGSLPEKDSSDSQTYKWKTENEKIIIENFTDYAYFVRQDGNLVGKNQREDRVFVINK